MSHPKFKVAVFSLAISYPDKDDAWPEGCLATSQKLIDERPELVQSVVNAVVAATEFARNNRSEALEIAMRHVGYLGAEAVEGNTTCCASGTPTTLARLRSSTSSKSLS